ncbi:MULTISPECIES: LuxR C-terminal-related transcriptional regulator [unclassified Blastococcus]
MGPLLNTKLHVPRRRRGLVPRPRLIERLSRGDAALTLVSAPAGFGKTTLLTEWLAATAEGRSIAWVSLDERDDDPVVFWTYVVAALRTAVDGAGVGALAVLQEARSSIDEVLATLVNELDTVHDDVVLVLDDYHVVSSPEVHDQLSYFLERLPPHVHLVIATRADPVLPLARLRARGELVEVRAADLRFTAAEAAVYLNEAMGLTLTAEHVAALDARTEGWIAALQLAALSMQGRDDVAGFIAGFAGDDRYIVDYLAEEVLQRQPADVRTFLLQTSILSRFDGALCDAVTGRDDGRELLGTLERANLFLVPLDDRRHWYRFHHLFADVLRARLLAERPETVSQLHRRAGAWFERNGDRSEAIEHALAAGDHQRAADLIERAIPVLTQGRQEVTLRRWMESLPVESFRTRPVLGVGYAGALMSTGELSGVEPLLRDAERWLEDPSSAAETPVADLDAARRLPGQLAMHRAGYALASGDVAAGMAHARRALDLAAPDDHLARGGPAAILGLAYWTTGDLAAAHRWYAQGMACLDEGGYSSDVVGGAVTLADIRIAQGRLREAMGIYERGLARAETAVPPLRGAADMHVGMSRLFLERDDREAARHHLARSEELGTRADLPKNPHRRLLARARLAELDGDLAAALDLLDEAERRYDGDFSPDVRPIPAVRARLWLADGRLADAVDWVRERGLSVDDDLSYVREFEHITLVRVLLARYAADRAPSVLREATGLTERLLRAAEEGQRTGSVIELQVLTALARRADGDVRGAVGPLERALDLAEPEGLVRLFLDEGPTMAELLQAAAERGTAPAYARRLLDAGPDGHVGTAVQHGLADPLSVRELEVLRLLGSDLDGPAIARRLFVSLNTLRTHTRNVYAKLGVSSRRAAVRRAGELGLLPR